MTEWLDNSTLVEREAIRDCVMRAAMANDMRDPVMWKSVYWPEATEDHSPMFVGNAHQFVDVVIPMLEKTMETTWHQIGNVFIRLEGERARVTTYASAHVLMKAREGKASYNLCAGVRYIDRFERRGPEWRVLQRVTRSNWMIKIPYVHDAGGFQEMPADRAIQNPSDPGRLLFDGAMPGPLLVKNISGN